MCATFSIGTINPGAGLKASRSRSPNEAWVSTTGCPHSVGCFGGFGSEDPQPASAMARPRAASRAPAGRATVELAIGNDSHVQKLGQYQPGAGAERIGRHVTGAPALSSVGPR